MTTTIISGTIPNSINLATPAYASPTTITGTITNSGDSAVFISSAWSLDVTGEISSGGGFGIESNGALTLTNAGIIHARAFSGLFLDGDSDITNAKHATITGGLQGIYSYYKATSRINNAGYIGAGETGIKIGSGLVDNTQTGIITGQTIGVTFTESGTVENAGLIQAGDYGGIGIKMPGGQVTNTGTIIGQTGIALAGGIITNTGTIEGESLTANGTLAPSAYGTAISFTAAGLLQEDAGGIILGAVTGDGGMLQIGATYLAGIGQTITGFAADAFTPGESGTLSGLSAGFGTISNFATGDAIHLLDVNATTGNFSNGALELSIFGFFTGAALNFAGTYTDANFQVQIDPNGGTDIFFVACFLAGTLITTETGPVPVETLQIGDTLPTLHGGPKRIKWIGRRSYSRLFAAKNPDVQPVTLLPSALAPGIPARALSISPGHALFIGGHLIPARNLVNGVTIIEAPLPDELHYFHIELETQEIIFAESCPVESFLDTGCRAQFQNFVEYLHLYGDSAPATPSYKLLEDGFTLEAIKARLGTRAGLKPAPGYGPLRGFLETTGPTRLRGWAQDRLRPHKPVVLDALANGRPFTRLIANRHRADLRLAGLGRGFYGFDIPLPAGLTGPFTVQRSIDGTPLPAIRPCEERSDAAIQTG